ncbi:MAG: S8 family serine peptidase [Chloroflexota bacterium]|nr:S8 family serine peptidase [Chloroflexota bacterium]MDQ5865699.1 S8 family serine peptidase [Chloroflexota bacterium]
MSFTNTANIESVRSLAARVARQSESSTATTASLKANSMESLNSLLKSKIVRQASREAAKLNNTKPGSVVHPFWAANSALIDISSSDLQRLPEEVPEVRGIYVNRKLGVPRLVEARNLPATVLEHKASAWGVNKIGALSVWGAYGARGRGVRVGVLDTGVDDKHPDLKGKIVAWAEFDSEGKNVAGSKAHDSDKHGTHCSGIIAGGNNSGQWIGVAPEAELAVALVLNGDQGGTDAQVLQGIQWLLEQRVHVISMSLGGLTLDPETPDTYTEAILTCIRAGVPVVTAIGNDGSETTGSPGNDLFAFSVGATDYNDKPAGFSGGRTHIIRRSNFIPPQNLPLPYSKPEVSAPGVAVMSSVPGGKWEAFNGTSMATPHVAGAIALLLSCTSILDVVDSNKRAFLIQDLLSGAVEELGESGQDHRYGFGRIDILRTIGYAIERGYGRNNS